MHFGREKGNQLSTNATSEGIQGAYWGGRCYNSCVRTHLHISFDSFGSIFVFVLSFVLFAEI